VPGDNLFHLVPSLYIISPFAPASVVITLDDNIVLDKVPVVMFDALIFVTVLLEPDIVLLVNIWLSFKVATVESIASVPVDVMGPPVNPVPVLTRVTLPPPPPPEEAISIVWPV
jgi:hypothetical protein